MEEDLTHYVHTYIYIHVYRYNVHVYAGGLRVYVLTSGTICIKIVGENLNI